MIGASPELEPIESLEIARTLLFDKKLGATALNNFRANLAGGIYREYARRLHNLHLPVLSFENRFETPSRFFTLVDQAAREVGCDIDVIKSYNHYIDSGRKVIPRLESQQKQETLAYLVNRGRIRASRVKDLTKYHERIDLDFYFSVFPIAEYLVNQGYPYKDITA